MNTHTTEFSLNVNVSLWIVKDISEFRPMIKLWFTYRNEYFLQNGYRIIAARTRPLDGIYIGTNAFFSMWPFISTSSKVGSFDNRKAPCNRGKVNCSTKIRFLAHDSVEHPRLALPDGKMLYFCRMLILLDAVYCLVSRAHTHLLCCGPFQFKTAASNQAEVVNRPDRPASAFAPVISSQQRPPTPALPVPSQGGLFDSYLGIEKRFFFVEHSVQFFFWYFWFCQTTFF